jgi:Tol biopolymer transport system component
MIRSRFFVASALVALTSTSLLSACGDDGTGGSAGSPSTGGGGSPSTGGSGATGGDGGAPTGGAPTGGAPTGGAPTGGAGGDGGAPSTGGAGGATTGGAGGAGGDGGMGGEGGMAPQIDQSAYFYGDFATDGVHQVALTTFPGPVTNVLTLANLAADDISGFAISPSGAQIAVAGRDMANGTYSVILFNADGTGGTNLVTGAASNVDFDQLQFSPDGAWLAYRSDPTANGANELWVVPTSGGAPKRVSQAMSNNANDVASYAFAPSALVGVHLAYSADPTTDNAFSLYAVEITAATPTPVNVVPEVTAAGMTVASGEPVFDAMGRVYFRGDFEVDNVFRLYRANKDGSMRQAVPGTTAFTNGAGESSVGSLGMSPDGSTLVFAVDSPTQNLYQLQKLVLSGMTPMALTSFMVSSPPATATGPDFATAPAFSPDGALCAVKADWPADAADNDFSAWVVRLDGSAPTRLVKVPMGMNQDVETVGFSADSLRLFVRGDVLANNDNVLVSTTDLAAADQDPMALLVQNVVSGGDVNGLFVTR